VTGSRDAPRRVPAFYRLLARGGGLWLWWLSRLTGRAGGYAVTAEPLKADCPEGLVLGSYFFLEEEKEETAIRW